MQDIRAVSKRRRITIKSNSTRCRKHFDVEPFLTPQLRRFRESWAMLSIILCHAGYRGLTWLFISPSSWRELPCPLANLNFCVYRRARLLVFFFFVCCAFVFIAGDYVSVCVEGRSSFGEKIFNKILFVLAPDEIETHFGWAPSLLDNLSKY